MKLSEKQQTFTICVAQLILYATSKGYDLTFGDSYRDPRVHGSFGDKKSYSAGKSVHKLRLAVDFNLFIKGTWISDGSHVAWTDLGEYWETLNESARWGGKFKSKDSNHFSFKHWGCK